MISKEVDFNFQTTLYFYVSYNPNLFQYLTSITSVATPAY